MSYLPEHLIEAVDQRPDLVLGAALDAQAVVLFAGGALHGVCKIDDGAGDLSRQRGGEPIRDQDCRRDGRNADESIIAPVWVQGRHRYQNVYIAKYCALVRGWRGDLELICMHEHSSAG